MPAIKATDSKNIVVSNCEFIGFENVIELERVEDFVSTNNNFHGENDPRLLLKGLQDMICTADMDEVTKKQLVNKITSYFTSGAKNSSEQDKIKSLLAMIGTRAVDTFIQLSTAIAAGLVLKHL
jgi:nucleoid-associated protein YejK